MTAITAVTAQNTIGVTAVHQVPADVILEQVRAVAGDIGVDAVKVGMLGDPVTAQAVLEALALLDCPVVVDPVMVAESGAVLLDPAARQILSDKILPLAAVVTPNVPEACVLAGADPAAPPPSEELARRVHALGPPAVVVTGGHAGDGVDVYYDGREVVAIAGEWHPGGAAHGSGCTHSSALAAHLALGFTVLEAARAAREIASDAVRDGLRGIGAGAGPVNVLGL
jgi:hydroxymethylpyrimidine/phosphomethylpyrimidine kinase